MNFLALKLDECQKRKIRRWYYRQQDDGVLIFFWIAAALIVGCLFWIGIDAFATVFR